MTRQQTNKSTRQQIVMHQTLFQLWSRHRTTLTNITNGNGNYNITDLSLYKGRSLMRSKWQNCNRNL